MGEKMSSKYLMNVIIQQLELLKYMKSNFLFKFAVLLREKNMSVCMLDVLRC